MNRLKTHRWRNFRRKAWQCTRKEFKDIFTNDGIKTSLGRTLAVIFFVIIVFMFITTKRVDSSAVALELGLLAYGYGSKMLRSNGHSGIMNRGSSCPDDIGPVD